MKSHLPTARSAGFCTELDALGLTERTVIIVIGDHGESLGDHGEAAHGFFIYNSVTHVPFVIRAPYSATRSRRVTDPVRQVDILPTALDLLGGSPPGGISGVTLTPLMTGTPELRLDAYSEAMYPLHHYGWSDLRALRSGRYKIIDAPRPELYDIDRDPGEQTNLYDDRRALGDRMIAQLRSMEDRFAKTEAALPADDVDPEARERLAALGYVGSFVASASDARTGRADPKDKIGLFNKLGLATELARDRGPDGKSPYRPDHGPPERGGRRRILRSSTPGSCSASRASRTDSSRKPSTISRRTLQLKADYDIAVFNLAQTYRRMGDDDAALAGFEHYLTLDPKDPYALYQMGEIWLDRGNLDKAEALFRRVARDRSRGGVGQECAGSIGAAAGGRRHAPSG